MTGFRVLNVLLVVLLAVALVALAVLVPVEVALWFADRGSWVLPWRDSIATITSTRFDSSTFLIVSVAVAAVGLVLLLLETGRRTVRDLPAQPVGDAEVVVTRKGVTNTARAAAERVEGISSAAVSARGRSVKVVADAQVRDTAGLDEQVRNAVTERVSALAPQREPKITVDVRGAG